MGIEYNGGSLVPDLSNSLRMAMGIAEKYQADQKEKKDQDELAGLEQSLPTGNTEALLQPDNVKILQRMARIDPNAAKFAIGIAQMRDQRELESTKTEAQDASRFYQAFLDTKDPAERTRFLTQTIREREAAGKDTTKLNELIGLSGDKQALMARRQMILAGDAELLADNSMAALKNALEVQGLQLKNLQTQQQMQRDATEAARGKDSDVAGLRKEFTSQAQPFVSVRDAYGRLQASAKRDSAAGDLALIFNYMKMLDPGSTVREGEFATAQNSGGVSDKLRNMYNRAIDGERLQPNQRADFLNTAGSLFNQQKASHKKLRDEYGRIATRRGFAPEDVLVDFESISAPPDAAVGGDAAPSVPASQYQEGTVLKNSATGQRWTVKGGQWQLLQ